MDQTPPKPTSHLTRLSRYLLAGGLVAVFSSALLQWEQLEGGGSGLHDYGLVLTAQLLMVVGTVALTGAVFGFVLLAVRRDRETSGVEGQAPNANWYE